MEIILEDNVEYCVGDVILVTFIDRFRACNQFLYRIAGKTYEGELNMEGEYQAYHYIASCDVLHIETLTRFSHDEKYIPIKNK